MFNTGLGQCGPKVPLFKSLFHLHKSLDEASFRRADREAELQLIWREIGEHKSQKLEEIRQMVSDAVDKIYNLALEESLRRKAALQESVNKSENRLKGLLGPDAVQAIAPEELPLQSRLSLNMARLHDLDSVRVGGYGWIGGLVVLVELRDRVAALREMLKLPPCNSSADIDEVIASTTEALHNLYPGRLPPMSSFPTCKGEQKLIFQRLQRFYQTLCAMENAWVESFAQKDQERETGCLDGAVISARSDLPEQEARSKKHHDFLCQGRENLLSAIPVSPFGCAIKRRGLKFINKSRKRRNGKQYSEESSTLEQLSHKILKKLEELNRQVKVAIRVPDDSQRFCSPSSSLDSQFSSSSTTIDKSFYEVKPYSPMYSASVSPSSDEIKGADTPTSVLPETLQRTAGSGYYINIGTMIWPPAALAAEAVHSISDHQVVLEASNAFSCVWKRNDQTANKITKQSGIHATSGSSEATNNMKPVNLFAVENENAVEKLQLFPSRDSSIQSKQPLAAITNSQLNPDPAVSIKRAGALPPPPPPPPPPPMGARPLRQSKSTKLKRSATMGKLYIAIKKKVEGADFIQSAASEIAVSHRTSLGGGDAREGMAETLAEITRKSAYFRKIEDDVQHHASSVLEVKSALESFETDNMEALLQFHNRLEAQLEQLTDESQVLARFEGFPFKKLDTVRMAASLYLRLRSTVQHIENWQVEPPASEQVGKISSFFDKVKVEVEAIERTKDEDAKLFTAQNIRFSFEAITRIKEAMVDLSSSLSALALKESKKTKMSTTNRRDGYVSGSDMNRLRIAFQILWKAFQLSFRVYNFAGGQDEKAEELTSELAKEMETFPASILVAS